MTVKEYLRQARYLDNRINYHIREKERLRQMLGSISSPRMEEDKVQTSPSGEAPFVKILMKVMEMEERITAEIDLLVDLKDQINAAIDVLADEDERMVLKLHYIDGYSYSKVADELSFGRATVVRKHDHAIMKLALPDSPITI